MTPPVHRITRHDTHRLISSKYRPREESVLGLIANDDEHLKAIFDFDNATNERLLAERQLLPGISAQELVFGVPYASVVNASFTHAHPEGSRFNGPDRGAWYAAFELETSQAEISFHKAVALAEIGRFYDEVTYDDYLADFNSDFHDLREAPEFAGCLAPESYVESQRLAEELLESGSHGVAYPSVRRDGGNCLACFVPALVTNVRKGRSYRFAWTGEPAPEITEF
ncbi:RES domain-containing protein [Acidobacteria bacterium AB60]|nr:RES domain-containing protein [Acidobacteria bacterium AB60]